MTIAELIPGATYLIKSPCPWSGKGVYIGPDISGHYPEGTLEFACQDDMTGMFSIEDVIALVKEPPKPLAFWVRQLLADLPEKRDWLNPDVERNLRELVK